VVDKNSINFVLLTGISGAGKSVALKYLEDIGYACVDNLPVSLLDEFIASAQQSDEPRVAVAIDARSSGNLQLLPEHLSKYRKEGINIKVLFLDADDNTLVQRYSESRRGHPLARRLTLHGQPPSLLACIHKERELLEELRNQEHVIDTSGISPAQLRHWMRDWVGLQRPGIILTIQSFAFKIGSPGDADLVFDVRCLPNPHYEPALKNQTGMDPDVAQWLSKFPEVKEMVDDIEKFVRKWLPRYTMDTRAYFTIAIGCTGGQHRSVYVAEQLAKRLSDTTELLIRHRNRPELS